ncbi:hypothetical protein HPB50_006530 [Hyalomma asiaticum]|uniref:Uncharacterized protein n=1 Tax=Hyalomma asiaticum TaxID=266040 RepID=A0ACB7STL7_HYAAI|nr:hypothetical protein HPB50_006530 [Hyalomma asiaticum]
MWDSHFRYAGLKPSLDWNAHPVGLPVIATKRKQHLVRPTRHDRAIQGGQASHPRRYPTLAAEKKGASAQGLVLHKRSV